MKAIKNLVTTATLLGSGAALAHGMHVDAPADSLLHLLAHNWPLLLVAASLATAWFLVRKTR